MQKLPIMKSEKDQSQHMRTSKTGKVFSAGKGSKVEDAEFDKYKKQEDFKVGDKLKVHAMRQQLLYHHGNSGRDKETIKTLEIIAEGRNKSFIVKDISRKKPGAGIYCFSWNKENGSARMSNSKSRFEILNFVK